MPFNTLILNLLAWYFVPFKYHAADLLWSALDVSETFPFLQLSLLVPTISVYSLLWRSIFPCCCLTTLAMETVAYIEVEVFVLQTWLMDLCLEWNILNEPNSEVHCSCWSAPRGAAGCVLTLAICFSLQLHLPEEMTSDPDVKFMAMSPPLLRQRDAKQAFDFCCLQILRRQRRRELGSTHQRMLISYFSQKMLSYSQLQQTKSESLLF